jgi:serralysin
VIAARALVIARPLPALPPFPKRHDAMPREGGGMSDVPGDTSSTVTLASGSFLYGEIDAVGDADWYRFWFTPGEVWRFYWAALSADDAVGADLSLYDAAGQLLFTVDNPGDWTDIWAIATPPTEGWYYIAIGGAGDAPETGGYGLAARVVQGTPLDAIDWGTKLLDPVVDIFFAPAGGTYESYDGPLSAQAWDSYVIAQEMLAFGEYAKVANLTFRQAASQAEADLTLVHYRTDIDLKDAFGFFSPAGTWYEKLGGVNADNPVWQPYPGGSIAQGGKDFDKMLHEAGHALGLAHTHDEGGLSVVLQGVDGTDDTGDFDLNQSVFTVMSYVEGWVAGIGVPRVPDGSLDRSHGYAGTPMALDIAAIQAKYGANMSWRTGDDVYRLPDANGIGTFWACLWDAGGHDAISAAGSALGAVIDLRAATLRYEAGGGGFLSRNEGIFGGLTIASGVVIEDATGGDGADRLTGNAGGNRLEGGLGNDVLFGGGGGDAYAFAFAAETATEWFRPNEAGTGGLTPSATASVQAWRVYTEQLAAWRAALEAQFGPDADAATRSVTVPDGRGSTVFTFDPGYTRVTALQGQGTDVVEDWEAADRLAFSGISRAQFLNALGGGAASIAQESGDTVLRWGDGAIVLDGVQVSAAALTGGGILFA